MRLERPGVDLLRPLYNCSDCRVTPDERAPYGTRKRLTGVPSIWREVIFNTQNANGLIFVKCTRSAAC